LTLPVNFLTLPVNFFTLSNYFLTLQPFVIFWGSFWHACLHFGTVPGSLLTSLKTSSAHLLHLLRAPLWLKK
jgi:hypothetical protein